MKWTIVGLILAGIAAALCAALLVVGARSPEGEVAEAETDLVEIEVLTASRALPAMTIVDGTAVGTKLVQADEVAEDARLQYTDVVGQVLLSPLVEGEVFASRHFASKDSGVHLAATLPEGRRAMSAMLTDDSGITDLLYPGCVVDVIASFRLPSSNNVASGEVMSATLLQGVQVLAIGPRSIVDGTEAEHEGGIAPAIDRKARRRVTFMVDPNQAEALQLAISHGELSVAMRNPLDVQTEEDRGVLLTDLSADLASRLSQMTPADARHEPIAIGQPTERPARAEVWTTEVVRGLQYEKLTFPIAQKK